LSGGPTNVELIQLYDAMMFHINAQFQLWLTVTLGVIIASFRCGECAFEAAQLAHGRPLPLHFFASLRGFVWIIGSVAMVNFIFKGQPKPSAAPAK
jgi:hypothetical protein